MYLFVKVVLKSLNGTIPYHYFNNKNRIGLRTSDDKTSPYGDGNLSVTVVKVKDSQRFSF